MSLNGLDAPVLTEAFGKACAEPGSWFWIKYTSRDDVEFLCQGANGTEEMRDAAAKEPDDSPLYGFIRFRRRNILVKYVPEGTSRVLKARSQVHFQSVAERFIPNDTTFSISFPKELRDNALTSACSTHTATASISSSNSSLRARRLTDIAESADEEEPPTTAISAGSPMVFGQMDGKGKNGQGLAVVITAHDSSIADGGPGSPVFLDGDRDLLGSPLSASFSRDSLEPRRKSTGTSPRPSTTDLYGPYIYTPKEKVRLGPRPHVEPVKRPHTSGERSKTFPTPEQEIRPVVSVPKSVQIPPRKSKDSRTRSLSNESLRSNSDTSTPHFPSIEDSPPPSPQSLSPTPPQEPLLTPEKQRLMKALQLRRRTMMPESKEQLVPKRDEELDTQGMKESDEAKSIIETDPDEDEDDEEGRGVVSQKVAEPGSSKTTGELETEDTVKEGVESKGENGQVETGDLGQGFGEQDKLQESPDELQPVESTKVRGEPDSDVDTESDHAEISIMTDSRPITMTAIQQPIPSMIKNSSRVSHPPKPPSPDPSDPKVLKRTDRPVAESIPLNEISSTDSTRSVSAPFLKTARDSMKPPPTAARKVNVGGGGGGVAQRIRQLEMLSVQKAAAAAAGKSPPGSRASSPAPPIPQYHPNRPASVHVAVGLRRMSNPLAPIRPAASPPSTPNPLPGTGNSTESFSSTLRSVISTPSLPKSSPPTSSPSPRMEIIERNNRPELQVTTQICRDEQGSPQPSAPAPAPIPESARSLKNPNSFSRRSSIDTSVQDSILRSKGIEAGPPSTASSRRQSIDRSILPRLSSSKDLENLSGNISSPVSPRPSTTDSKKSKKDKGKERRGSSSSSGGSSKERSSRSKSKSPTTPKSPKSPGFLQRMSASLTSKKSKEEAPAPVAPVVLAQPAKRTYLLAGWINAQLPDTMLWRRRCMKIDSSGWLFLSLSEDENSPQTRRYHIPSEIRSVDLPDMDEQELPHSVRLHLQEGGTLQCACQNAGEQKEVLGVIRGRIA